MRLLAIVTRLLALCSFTLAAVAGAQGWPADGQSLGSYAGSLGLADLDVFPDGAGGVQGAWLMGGLHGVPFGPAFHGHVLADGSYPAGYGPGGRYVLDTLRTTYTVHGASDGAGGAWVVWWTAQELLRLHVDAHGDPVPGEPDTGVVLRTEQVPLDGVGIARVRMVGFGAEGFALVWPGYTYTPARGWWANRILAQKYDAAGVAQWPVTSGETALRIAPVSTTPYTLLGTVSDASGGIFAAFSTDSAGVTVRANRILSSGSPAWSAGAVTVSSRFQGVFGDVLGDGAGGAWLAWWEVGPPGEGQVRVQHVLGTRLREWGPAVATGPGEASWNVTHLALAAAPENNLIVAWRDAGATGVPPAVRGQRLDTDGGPVWDANSVGLLEPGWDVPFTAPAISVLEDGAFWVAAGSDQVRVRRFGADGAPWIPLEETVPYGEVVGFVRDAGHAPLLVFLQAGRIRVLPPERLIAAVGAQSPAPLLFATIGNPARGARTLSFVLPSAGPAQLDVLDVSGRRVASRAFAAMAPGPHEVRLDDAATWPTGIYFARLRACGASAVLRLVQLGR